MSTRPVPILLCTFLTAAVVGCSGNSGSTTGPGTAGGSGGASPSGGSGGAAPTAGGGGSGGMAGAGGGGGSPISGGPGGTGGTGGGQQVDASASPGDGGGAPAAPGAVQCGTMMLDTSKVKGAENVIVGPDGTVYTSSRSPVMGRYAPPYDKPQDNWATAPMGSVFGIILDPKKKVLYAGSRAGKMYAVSTDDPAKIDLVTNVQGGVNGLTLGDDGLVYYSDQTGSGVYVVNPAMKMETKVNKTPVPQANGIAFAPDGRLCATTYTQPATMICMKLDANHLEMSRDTVMIGGKNGDGLAFDKAGNAYVQAGALFKVSADGKMVTMAAAMGGANVEFGAGPLSCKTLYMANSAGVRSFTADLEGFEVPWHKM